jgi:hypothetical protein
VEDDERDVEIDRLLKRLSETTAREAALMSEARELAARIPEIRAAFGNPYFYRGANHGRPENAQDSVGKYTGYTSHAVVLPTVLGLRDAHREARTIREQLRALGASVE